MTKGVYSFYFGHSFIMFWFAFFNLIPIPPLDGSKIFRRTAAAADCLSQYENMVGQYGFYILLALVFASIVGMSRKADRICAKASGVCA